MTLDQLPELMTVEHVRAYTSLGRNAIYDAIRRKQLEAIALGPRQTRVTKAALEAWLERCSTTTANPAAPASGRTNTPATSWGRASR